MRNIPTTRARRLRAVRLSRKARVIWSRAPAREPAGTMAAPAGRMARIPAMRCAPASPSGMTRSMRERRPSMARSSWAVARSVTRTESSPRRLSSSPAARNPARVRRRTLPWTSTAKVPPSFTPRRSAVCRRSIPVSGTAMSASRTLPLEKWELKARMGGSAKGSMPMSRRVVPARPATCTYPSTTGAFRRIPWVTRSVR